MRSWKKEVRSTKNLKTKFYFLLLLFVLISCTKRFLVKEDYPQLVVKEEGVYPVESCYEVKLDSFNKVPKKIHLVINNYLKSKVGQNYFKKIKFDLGYIHSNIPLPIKTKISETELILYGEAGRPPKTDCDSTYKYPVYWLGFDLPLKEKGIQKLGFNVIVDNSGKIIRDYGLPKIGNNLISIDSIHSLLIARNISPKKLSIRLAYNQKSDALFWYTSTLIQNDSIMGSSCFPIRKRHFKMDAITGEIIDFDSEKSTDYFEN